MILNFLPRNVIKCLAGVFLLLLSLQLSAQTTITSGNTVLASNITANTAVIIERGGTLSMDVARTFTTLTVNTTGTGTSAIIGSNTLTLTGAITIAGGSTLSVGNTGGISGTSLTSSGTGIATLTGSSNVTLSGNITLLQGVNDGVTLTGNPLVINNITVNAVSLATPAPGAQYQCSVSGTGTLVLSSTILLGDAGTGQNNSDIDIWLRKIVLAGATQNGTFNGNPRRIQLHFSGYVCFTGLTFTLTNITLTTVYSNNAILEYQGATALTVTASEWPATQTVIDSNLSIIINTASGVTLGAARTLSGNLTLANGTFTNGANLTLSGGDTIYRTGGSIGTAPTFGTSVHLVYNQHTASVTTANEWPATASVLSSLTINNSNGVTLNTSRQVNGPITLTSGNFNLGANTLTIASTSINRNGSTQTGTITATSGTLNFANASSLSVPTGIFSGNLGGVTLTSGSTTFNENLTATGALSVGNGNLVLAATVNFGINGSVARPGTGTITASATGANITFGGAGNQTVPAGTFNGSLTNLTLNKTNTTDVVTIQNNYTVTGTTYIMRGVLARGTSSLTSTNCINVRQDTTATGTGALSCGGAVIAGGNYDVLDLETISEPEITIGENTTVKDLKLNNGKALAIGPNKKLKITGQITGTGQIKGGSTADLEISSTSNNTVYFDQTNNGNTNALQKFTVSGSGTVTLGNTVRIIGSTEITGGSTLTTNDNLVITDDGLIGRLDDNGDGTGAIAGKVIVEMIIPRERAFRLIANPFAHNISVKQMTDDIDITGTTATPPGSNNGFTWNTVNGATNNPSAFWFNATVGTNTSGNNPGWIAFTDTYDSLGSNSWKVNQGIRVMVRGTKGQGLDGQAYTYQAPTIDLIGYVNDKSATTPVNISASVAGQSNFEAIVNPYVSPIQISSLVPTNNVNTGFWVWDATAGVRGAYSTRLFTSTSTLPKFTTLIVERNTATSTGAVTYSESFKTTSATSLFKKGSKRFEQSISIDVRSDSMAWDAFDILFKPTFSAGFERAEDIKKFLNPDMNIYSMLGSELIAIEGRPMPTDEEVITLHTKYPASGKYIFDFSPSDLPAGFTVHLADRYAKKEVLVTPTTSYAFEVDINDTLSKDVNRFQLILNKKATSMNELQVGGLSIYPNPANEQLGIILPVYPSTTSLTLELTNALGQTVYTESLEAGAQQASISVAHLPKGFYVLNVHGLEKLLTQKIIKN
jgi:hypothetical protein